MQLLIRKVKFLARHKVDFTTLFGEYRIVPDSEGRELKLAILGLGELAEFTTWYKYLPLREAEIATKLLPEDVRKEELRQVYKECRERDLNIEDKSISEGMQTPAGLAYLLFLSLRMNYPDIKEKDVSKIFNLKNQEVIDDYSMYVIGVEKPQEGELMDQLATMKM